MAYCSFNWFGLVIGDDQALWLLLHNFSTHCDVGLKYIIKWFYYYIITYIVITKILHSIVNKF